MDMSIDYEALGVSLSMMTIWFTGLAYLSVARQFVSSEWIVVVLLIVLLASCTVPPTILLEVKRERDDTQDGLL